MFHMLRLLGVSVCLDLFCVSFVRASCAFRLLVFLGCSVCSVFCSGVSVKTSWVFCLLGLLKLCNTHLQYKSCNTRWHLQNQQLQKTIANYHSRKRSSEFEKFKTTITKTSWDAQGRTPQRSQHTCRYIP